MITIQIGENTYKVHATHIHGVILKWLENGYIEEVKENKAPEEIFAEDIRKQSIITKLREEIIKEIKNLEENPAWMHEIYIAKGLQQALCILDSLTSLETLPISKMETDETEEVIVPEFDYEELSVNS